jgi:hypothetical protein
MLAVSSIFQIISEYPPLTVRTMVRAPAVE